jgi:uncharacterized repeat protein (TIGR04138 family)
MAAMTLESKIEELVLRDRRYAAEAYHFVFEAIDFAMLERRRFQSSRHVGVPELLAAIRNLALEQFGPLARCVLESWRVYETDDFGEIVFNLIANDLLNQSESDRKEDFMGGFDFREVFEESYRPCVRAD